MLKMLKYKSFLLFKKANVLLFKICLNSKIQAVLLFWGFVIQHIKTFLNSGESRLFSDDTRYHRISS